MCVREVAGEERMRRNELGGWSLASKLTDYQRLIAIDNYAWMNELSLLLSSGMPGRSVGRMDEYDLSLCMRFGFGILAVVWLRF